MVVRIERLGTESLPDVPLEFFNGIEDDDNSEEETENEIEIKINSKVGIGSYISSNNNLQAINSRSSMFPK